MVPVKSSAHDMKNSYSVFERPFKLLKNDVFLSIYRYNTYLRFLLCILGKLQRHESTTGKYFKILNYKYLWKYRHQKCT